MNDSRFARAWGNARTLTATTAVALVALAASSAHAERRDLDCGQTGWYAPSSWPGFKGCPTGLGLSGLAGAADTVPQFATLLTLFPLSGQVAAPPVFGADGTAFVGTSEEYVVGVSKAGQVVWWSYMFGRVRASAAVGIDGTVYVSSDAGYLYALDPRTGAHKWAHLGLPFISVYGAPAIGPDGTIYYGDSAGWIYAVYPNGQRKWAFFMAGAVRATPVLSRDGKTLYIGDEFFKFRALDAQTGALKWLTPVLTGDTATAAVGDDGTVYVASSAGNVHALNPTNGNSIWTYPTLSIIHSSPAIAPNGDIIVADVFGYLTALTPAGAWRWTQYLGGRISSSPVVDKNGVIYVGTGGNFHFSVGAIGAILPGVKALHARNGSTGTQRWRYDTVGGVASSPAISQRGTIYFGADDGYLYAIGTPITGAQTRPTWPEDTVRISTSAGGFPANPAPVTIARNGCANPAARFNKTVDPSNPSFGLVKNVSLVDPSPATACGGHLCGINSNTDDPTVFTQTPIASNEAALLSAPSDGSATNRNLPVSAVAGCGGTPAPATCPIDPTTVVTTGVCTLDTDCISAHGPTFRCVSVYLSDGQTGTVVTSIPAPPAVLTHSQPVMRCGRPFTSGTDECTGGGMPFVTGPAPLVGTVPARTADYQNFPCHEVRECADPGALLDNATPNCGPGNPTCQANLTSTLVTAPLFPPPTPGPVVMSERDYFDRTNLMNTKCSFGQAGNASGGKGSGFPGGKQSGPGTSSNWGVDFQPDFGAAATVSPRPFGFFSPNFNVSAHWAATGIAFGKSIPIFDVRAGIDLNICNQNASVSAMLFGQNVSAIVGIDTGPSMSVANRNTCDNLLIASAEDLKWLKNATVNAQQIFKGLRGGIRLTKDMCQSARFDPALGALCNAPTVNRNLAAQVYNKYVTDYNTQFSNLKGELHEEITRVLGVAGKGHFENGYAGSINFLDGEQRFAIRVVNASIPIGPFQVVLVVEGGGYWGLNGELDYNAQLYPWPTSATNPVPTNPTKKPGVGAGVSIGPEAGANVLLYVGVGIGISGVAGADVGIGGTVNLVDISTPILVRGEINRTAQGTDARVPATGFGEPGGILALKPNSRIQTFDWKFKDTLSARASMTLLSGALDLRLRVYFLFFSKTWKKQVAKLKGFKPPDITIIEGSTPLSALVLESPVPMVALPEITFPEVPTLPASDALFAPYNTPAAWGVAAVGSDADKLEDVLAISCHPPVMVD